MGYMHINNLYKDQRILLFKECYALEKIHGTSAHISWKDENLHFSSGGTAHQDFVSLFSNTNLEENFIVLGHTDVVVYGEAYGGRMQAMSEVYGKVLRFVVFDVKIDGNWLSVTSAEDVAKKLDLEFVHYKRASTDLYILDRLRNEPSVQAARNGIQEKKPREGIVLRPLEEMYTNNDKRVIAKYKNDAFSETTKPRKIQDPKKLEIIRCATDVAMEWVTPMRLTHILSTFDNPSIEDMREIILAMIDDIHREGEGEIEWTQSTGKAIGRRTAVLAKKVFTDQLSDQAG